MIGQIFRCLMVLLFLLTGTYVSAGTLADKVEQHQLDNGATVLFVERHSSPTVSAYISFGVGSVNETSVQRGAAHLLEHMLFKGTKTLGTKDYQAEKKLLAEIEKLGEQIDHVKNQTPVNDDQLSRLRQQLKQLQDQHRSLVVKDEFSKIYAQNGGVGYNAFTGKDQTTYLINLPANKLELWAAIESDRLQNAVFREFFTERDVVHEERRRSYESNPGGMLYETLIATAFKVHSYRDPVIGWNSDIDNLSLEDIRTFFEKYYRPANMVITLVGDFDSVNALAMIKRYFGPIDSGVKVPVVTDKEPPQNGQRRVHISYDAEPQMMMAFHKPTLPAYDDYVFDLIMQLLTEGRTSRLYQSLVLKQQLVASVGSFTAPGSRYDNLMILAFSPRKGVSFKQVEDAVYREIERLRTDPVTYAELNKAKKQITTGMLQRLQDNSGLARMLSSYQVLGDWRYLVDYEKNLKKVSPDDVMSAIKKYLKTDNETVATLGRGENI